eukprot:5971028-Karenia_brevis.AAC.1
MDLVVYVLCAMEGCLGGGGVVLHVTWLCCRISSAVEMSQLGCVWWSGWTPCFGLLSGEANA